MSFARYKAFDSLEFDVVDPKRGGPLQIRRQTSVSRATRSSPQFENESHSRTSASLELTLRAQARHLGSNLAFSGGVVCAIVHKMAPVCTTFALGALF